MAKKIQQIRFHTLTDANILDEEAELLVKGKAFEEYLQGGGIEQLGIQAIPGTKFYLNSSVDPVIVGSTGIYELDLTDKASIDALRFDADSINLIKNSNSLSLLIDLVYKEG